MFITRGCKIRLEAPQAVIPGTTYRGAVVIEAEKPIKRAERIELAFHSKSWAGFGSGKNRSVKRQDLFYAPLALEIPEEGLGAGTHRHPFAVDVPPWLPPGIQGTDCGIDHEIDVRLDVDWSIDPKEEFAPTIAPAAVSAQREPAVIRTPPQFHKSMVLELTLASKVVATGEPIEGQIALRDGHKEKFDGVVLCLTSIRTIHLGRGDVRTLDAIHGIKVPADALRGGQTIPFRLPPMPDAPPTFRSPAISHDVAVRVLVQIPWSTDPVCTVPLMMLPKGSSITGGGQAAVIGSDRMRQLARSMARESGLEPGTLPTYVEGKEGPVHVALRDSPREGQLGLDIEITYPDVELGLTFRKLGMLDGFRQSPLLPEAMRSGYFLRAEAGKGHPAYADEVVASFVASAVGGLERMADVRFTDHNLTFRIALRSDSSDDMAAVAKAARARAHGIAKALRHLPFPPSFASDQQAWESAANDRDAVLIASAPAIHGLRLQARILGGEERTISAKVLTTWDAEGPAHEVEVDLSAMPLPQDALGALAASSTDNTTLLAMRQTFPAEDTSARSPDRVTLRKAGWTPDPRALLDALELFFTWALQSRGERRADSPYR